GNDSLVGANLDDTLQGLDGNDTLRGRQGRDLLLGGDDRDRLFGHGGRDSLEGEAGNDRLFGGGGRDELNGGEGRDRLTGGAGADKFIFTNEGRDRVTDFSRSEGDIFQFDSGSYPNAPSSVTNPVVGFVSSTDPNVNIYVDTLANIENASGSVNFAYATDTNQLLYDEDGNWSSDSVVIADTNNFGTPTAANFDFI
ncbi:MAG: calcium-binding protein, partial [Xenococcaceae cyanobacterium MO_188.B19]|nr:calcium-binding protein [Xenococcaceae cyanobacterium MO_188.B19]